MNKLNKLYKAILESLGCTIKDDYAIVMRNLGNEYQVKVDGRQVYLPVSDALNTVASNRAFFHPACESIASKETEIDRALRKLISSSIYFNFCPIADVLFKVANKKTSKTLSNKVMEQIAPLRGLSKEVIAEVAYLIKSISMFIEYEGTDDRIIALTISRGGKTENDEHIYYRCTPSFPFYNELVRTINQNSGKADNPEAKLIIGGKQYSYQAALCVALIFEIAIPSVMDPSRAEAISTTQTAARMCAMLRSFGYIANEINTIVGKFRKEFDAIGVYGIETAWVEQLEDLPDIASLIPALEYNNYNTATRVQDPEQNSIYDPFNVSLVTPPTPVSQQPGIQPQQQPQPSNGEKTPQPPQPRNGETYIGMTALNNGLFEFRYQSGNVIRVICVNDSGKVLTENFTNAGNQINNPYNNGQPIYTNQNGWQQGNGYVIQPNGVVIPVLAPANAGGYDPYNQNGNNQNGGWGQPNNNQGGGGWGSSVTNNNHIMPSGSVNNNW